MDPVMGIVGALIISRWSYGLLKDTSSVLLDGEAHSEIASSIKGRNPMVDGFGLIAFASLIPMIFVMLYGILI